MWDWKGSGSRRMYSRISARKKKNLNLTTRMRGQNLFKAHFINHCTWAKMRFVERRPFNLYILQILGVKSPITLRYALFVCLFDVDCFASTFAWAKE